MLNDRSSALSLLETRRSGKPRELVGPGPTAAEMERILTIAARAPDHGTLTPWRFVTVADDQRDALEALLLRALAEQEPDAPPAKHQKERDFAHYQGALVVLVSAPVPDHKIPVWEQELSCGAAGMNLMLAAARARLCPGLGDRLARLFGSRAARLLRPGRADRGVHLHRPRRARARGTRAAAPGNGVAKLAPARRLKRLRH